MHAELTRNDDRMHFNRRSSTHKQRYLEDLRKVWDGRRIAMEGWRRREWNRDCEIQLRRSIRTMESWTLAVDGIGHI
jgi:hypothetical protein